MLEELRRQISEFDKGNLLANIGALNLDPKNASRTFSLEALAHLVASGPVESSAMGISNLELKCLLTEHVGANSLLGGADDKAPQLFTEDFLFHGGPYTVFPGPHAGGKEMLYWLLRGVLFQGPTKGLRQFCDEVKRASILCLATSNRIAQKAQLKRGLAPLGEREDEIVVPEPDVLRLGVDAVTFSWSDLVNLVQDKANLENTLEPLTTELGSVEWEEYRSESSRLNQTPFVRVASEYVVPSPSTLLTALCQRVIKLGQENEILSQVADAFHAEVHSEVEEMLKLWQFPPLQMSLPPHSTSQFSEGMYTFDSDKALYLQVATDPMLDFEVDGRDLVWETGTLDTELAERAALVTDLLLSHKKGLGGILILTVCQSMGRVIVIAFDDHPDKCQRLAMSADELRAITLADATEPLSLWKYARAHRRIRKRAVVIAFGTLDDYAFYRSHGNSYPIPEDDIPTCIVVPPGQSLELKRQIGEKVDPHGVLSFLGNSQFAIDEVWSLFGEGIPIFWTTGRNVPTGGNSLVVEGKLPFPFWVIAPAIVDESLHSVSKALMEMVAFWLWQFEIPLARFIERVSCQRPMFIIRLDWGDPSQWIDATKDPNGRFMGTRPPFTPKFVNEVQILLELNPNLLVQARRKDNQGERNFAWELLHWVMAALAWAHPQGKELFLAHSNIPDTLEQIAPIGPKRWIYINPPDLILNLGRTGLPRIRVIQDADVVDIHARMRAFVRRRIQFEAGKQQDFRSLLKDVLLDHLFGELKEQMAILNTFELLGHLVEILESFTWHIASHQYDVIPRMSCLVENKKWVETQIEETEAFETACMANRFLIEYAVACQSQGVQHWSLEAYDRLLAIGNEIAQWGAIDDCIHFGLLSEEDIAVLPNGQLDVDSTKLAAVRHSYAENFIRDEIGQLLKADTSQPKGKSGNTLEDPDALLGNLDQAFASEFGPSLTQLLQLMSSIYELGMELEGNVKSMSSTKLAVKLIEATGLDRQAVQDGINLLSLSRRNRFFEPPNQTWKDAVPWRFKRSWSYVRRPLLQIGTKESSRHMWGNRHLVNAMQYLCALCLGGRLEANTKCLKDAMSAWQRRAASQFEQLVGQILSQVTENVTKVGIDKVGRQKILGVDGQELGDIDVLGIIPEAHLLLVIECKDFGPARTPVEIDSQFKKLGIGDASKKSVMSKHQARVDWISGHLDEVLPRFFNEESGSQWSAKGILVSNYELYVHHFMELPMPVWSVECLKSKTVKELAAELCKV